MARESQSQPVLAQSFLSFSSLNWYSFSCERSFSFGVFLAWTPFPKVSSPNGKTYPMKYCTKRQRNRRKTFECFLFPGRKNINPSLKLVRLDRSNLPLDEREQYLGQSYDFEVLIGERCRAPLLKKIKISLKALPTLHFFLLISSHWVPALRAIFSLCWYKSAYMSRPPRK